MLEIIQRCQFLRKSYEKKEVSIDWDASPRY